MKRFLFYILFIFSMLSANLPVLSNISQTPTHSKKTAIRLISLAPNITEILFAIHAEKFLVGVSNFETYPPAVKQIPAVGGLLNPDFEKILSLHPDIIISVHSEFRIKHKLKQMNIQFWEYESNTLEDILNIIRDLGARLDKQKESEYLIHKINHCLSSLHSTEKPQRVMIVVGTTPGTVRHIFVAGGSSFLDTILEKLGYENIFHHVQKPFFEVSSESVFHAAPEMIIELAPGRYISDQEKTERQKEWGYFSTIPAVTNGRIFVFSEDYTLIPGPRIIETARLLERTLSKHSANFSGSIE